MTREHYYYQLRENVLRHGQPATEESFFRLAALALQAELGDHDPERHRGAYFDTQLYFPQWVSATRPAGLLCFFLFSVSLSLSLRPETAPHALFSGVRPAFSPLPALFA